MTGKRFRHSNWNPLLRGWIVTRHRKRNSVFAKLLVGYFVLSFLFSFKNIDNIKYDLAIVTKKKQEKKLPISRWRSMLEIRKKELYQKIQEEYGSNYSSAIFFHAVVNGADLVSRGRSLLISPFDQSLEDFLPSSVQGEDSTTGGNQTTAVVDIKLARGNLIRKIAIKLLEAHLYRDKQTTMVWATAGMSSAAGHGNFMTESYTYLIEQNASPLFKDLGILFQGRNYATSASFSAPETAFCIEEIYGNDVDLLVWDYAQTDMTNYWMMLLFSLRAARFIESHPVIAFLSMGSPKHFISQPRIELLRQLHQHGLPVLLESDFILEAAKDGVPTTFGKTQSEIEAMPRLVRNFKCGEEDETLLENGEPYCGEIDTIFNQSTCKDRRFRVKWHPGFRMHALKGYLRTLALLDAVEDAIQYLEQQGVSAEPGAILKRLKTKERLDYERFLTMELPDLATDWHQRQELPPEISAQVLWNEPSFCHTGRTPTQSRELGLVQSSNLTKDDAKMYFQPVDEGEMRFIDDDDRFDRKHIENCTEPVRWDYVDYYYAHQDEGWKSLVVPTDLEISNNYHHHIKNKVEFRGLVAVCMTVCGARKCPQERLSASDYEEGKGEMEVNGIRATNFTSLSDANMECHLLKHADGYSWPVDTKGRFRIRARALENNSFVRINSVIIW